jgi:ATPase subunit of ABC transporter with duplicated ATPase domains
MADLDYGEIRIYPGNYDEYMIASTQVKERMLADNAKKKTQIAELQAFVSRFSANASKARQATSRARQIEKIKLEDIKPSSRQYPYIRLDVEEREKLHRLAVSVQSISKQFAGMAKPLFHKFSMNVEAGEKIAIIGPNGIGKTTLLRCLADNLASDAGEVKWAEKARPGYFAQDHSADFEADLSLTDWMTQWRRENDDDQTVRSILGRLLFSGDEVKKSVKVVSGGEEGRLLFGKLMLQRNNVLLMDEPTNHLDMESIESLNSALEKYPGTLIFVSHDREFVSSLATRIIEMKPEGITDFKGSYEDYLQGQGIGMSFAASRSNMPASVEKEKRRASVK